MSKLPSQVVQPTLRPKSLSESRLDRSNQNEHQDQKPTRREDQELKELRYPEIYLLGQDRNPPAQDHPVREVREVRAT